MFQFLLNPNFASSDGTVESDTLLKYLFVSSPIKPSATDKDRGLWVFFCQAIFTAHSPQSCLRLCLESIMKLYVPLELTKLHPLPSIDPVLQLVFPRFTENSTTTHLHRVNNSYGTPSSLTRAGLCVYCSSQTGAVILSCPAVGWPIVFSAAQRQSPFPPSSVEFLFLSNNPIA